MGIVRRKFCAITAALIYLLVFCVAVEGQTAPLLDPVQVDPQHFKVEYEDARIRVLRFRLPPGQKSPMHDHAARSVVNLTNARVRLTFEDGALQEVVSVAGSVSHLAAMRYAVENIGDQVFETISTEFKDQAYVAKSLPSRPPALSAKATTRTEAPPLERPAMNAPATGVPAPVGTTTSAETKAAETKPPLTKPAEVARTMPAQPERQVTSGNANTAPPLQRETPEGVVKTLTVNGTEFAYVDRGQGTPIIFLHDTLGDYRSWSKSVESLSQNFRMISYSRRYHYPNYSSGKERDYTFQQNAKDLADFIRALNLGAVNLVGVGYGSSLAAMVAVKNPELVRSVVLADPEFVDLLPPARAEAARFTRDEIYHIIRKPLNKGQADIALQTYVDWGRGSGVWEHYSAETRSHEKQNANALKAQTYDTPSPALSCTDFRSIKAPVLLITGELAPPNARDIDTALSSCLGKVEQLRIPKTDYVGYIIDADALTQFLTKHR